MTIRAVFYYPWFPETWGTEPVAEPSIGRYSSTLGVIQNHIALMRYAKCKAAISSWWGPGSPYSDRFYDCLEAAQGTRFKWALYYEAEGYSDPSATSLSSDLFYVLDRWAAHENYLKIDGKPVIFAYAGANDGAAMAQRWKMASGGHFHVCLKLFHGFETVASQPDSWHEYAPANAISDFRPYSVSVSPGFAMSGQPVRLPRDLERFKADVKTMVEANAQWSLITTFNEHGEGTGVEPCIPWGSRFLDALAGKG